MKTPTRTATGSIKVAVSITGTGSVGETRQLASRLQNERNGSVYFQGARAAGPIGTTGPTVTRTARARLGSTAR